MELAKKQEKKSLGPFKARVLGQMWQHFWRIKHLEDVQGLKHDVDLSTKIVNRATIRANMACANFNALTTADNPIRVF
jgi:hypothetical protein